MMTSLILRIDQINRRLLNLMLNMTKRRKCAILSDKIEQEIEDLKEDINYRKNSTLCSYLTFRIDQCEELYDMIIQASLQ